MGELRFQSAKMRVPRLHAICAINICRMDFSRKAARRPASPFARSSHSLDRVLDFGIDGSDAIGSVREFAPPASAAPAVFVWCAPASLVLISRFHGAVAAVARLIFDLIENISGVAGQRIFALLRVVVCHFVGQKLALLS